MNRNMPMPVYKDNSEKRARKIALGLDIEGYTLDEIKRTIAVMLAMHGEELHAVYNSSDVTALEKIIGGLVLQSIGDRDPAILHLLLDRVYGKARQTLEITKTKSVLENIDTKNVDPINAARIYQRMMS